MRDSRGAVIHPAVLSGKFDPHYLTKALHLRPAGKAAARAGKDRSRSPRRSTGGEAKEEDRREREAPRVVSGAPARSGHHHDERRGRGESRDRGNHGRGTSPERPPLVRRPRESRQGPKKKKKNNRGQKRRDRGKNWRSSRASGSGPSRVVRMPPKAKAGAKAKAHPLHRPAARVRVRGVRRPAAGGGVSPWDLGQEVALATIPPGDLGPGCSLVITEGYYYGGKMKIAGEVTKLEMEAARST